MLPEPSSENAFLADHVTRLCVSYRQLTGRDLIASGDSPAARAEAIYRAPFVVLSHGTEADPIFKRLRESH